MSKFWMVMLVLAGAIVPLGCQSDPCNQQQGLFGRWRGFRHDNDYMTSGCGCSSCGSTLGTPVYSDGTIISGGVPSGIPMPAPSLPGPVGS